MNRVVIYRSRAITAFSDVDLYYLLAQAQERNELADITGLLVYDRGFFFQWLEGSDSALLEIWHSIQADARHYEIELLVDSPTEERRFCRWSMRFAHRDSRHARVVGGFIKLAADFSDRLHDDVESAARLLASLGGIPVA